MSTARDLEEFIDAIQLRHFRGAEFTPYWSRVRRGVRNHLPPESLWPNIVPTLIVLDEVRERLGVPVVLLSTYRSPAYNRAVGGESASYHMQFKAIDFSAMGASPRRCADTVAALRGRKFALPGHGGTFTFRGGLGRYRTFTHVDTRGRNANWPNP